jgi:hypothetical protein
MKYKNRGPRNLVIHDQSGKLVTYDIEVGRSIKEYRDRIAQRTHKAVEKIANSHFAKNTSVILAVALSAHCLYT